jgi:hypothetical protein
MLDLLGRLFGALGLLKLREKPLVRKGVIRKEKANSI